MSDSLRNRIFREELSKLKHGNFITLEDYEKIRGAYAKYCDPTKAKVNQQPSLNLNQQGSSKKINSKSVSRKIISPQEIRERNISFILVLGVFLVLMSGLLLATSNWDIMNDVVKTLSLVLISIVFFGVSWIAETKLKIFKTSFAFWVLGSLLMPISFLSVGYFKLFGQWLSLYGDGRYVLGIIGATICLPVYVYSSFKYKTRLFVWVGLIALSIDVAFILAAIDLPIDAFYFGLVLYNSLLILGYSKLRDRDNLKFFIKEVPLFIQCNLIISSVFVLFIFDNMMYYGLNIILLSAVYMAIVFIQGAKEYSFIFSILLVYGVYQFVEHSILVSMDVIIFAMLGFIFLALEKYLLKEEMLKKIFTYTSAVVSALSFIFITTRANITINNSPSVLILIAYILITLNYLYLAYNSKIKVFSYLTVMFLLAIGNQSSLIIKQAFGSLVLHYELYMYIVSAVILIVFYVCNKWKYTQCIKGESAVVTSIAMVLFIGQSLTLERFGETSVLLYCYGFMQYIIYKKAQVSLGKKIVKWLIPVALTLGTIAIYGEIIKYSSIHSESYDLDLHIGLSSLFIFGLSVLFKKYKSEFEETFFWVFHSFGVFTLFIAVIELIAGQNNFPIIPLCYIGVYGYSTLKYKDEIITRIFLYAAFITGYISIASVVKYINMPALRFEYAPFITSVLIGGLWLALNDCWKKRVFQYFIPFSLIGIVILNSANIFTVTHFVLAILYLIIMLYIINCTKVYILNVLPLATLLLCLDNFYSFVLKFNDQKMYLVCIIAFIILKITGELLFKKLYNVVIENKKIKSLFIDWYSVFAFIVLMLINPHSYQELWLVILPSVLLVYLMYSQIKRIEDSKGRKVAITLTILSSIIPYYSLLAEINVPQIIETELYVLPYMIIVMIICKKIWKEYEDNMRIIEMVVISIIYLVLLRDILLYNYLMDALILGVLSLTSIIIGAQLKIKSLFLLGSGALLLNVLLQTRQFWGRLPWWVYLLIAGLILIVTASINEMQKNKKSKLLQINKQAIKDKFKNWK